MPSMHKMAINRLSSDCIASGKAKDDTIEVIEYTKNNRALLGVQYHPELVNDKKIFDWLIKASLERKN